MTWWIRPLVRIGAALLLPFLVPAVITLVIWALPGDPVDILCPPGLCTGGEQLKERWCLDGGPAKFYGCWLSAAATLDLGRSWRVSQGVEVIRLFSSSLPETVVLVLIALVPISVSSVLAALGRLPRRLDSLWQVLGLAPAVILALLFAAVVEINYGPSGAFVPHLLRLLLGGFVLGVADGALAGAITGTRSVFEEEFKQRYVGIAVLRGESVVSNTLPNVLPALVGQFRSRVIHLLSGAVVVEVVLRIDGIGYLLWEATLKQDFGVLLAATWGFAILSSFLMLAQASVEIAVARWVRRSPPVPAVLEATA